MQLVYACSTRAGGASQSSRGVRHGPGGLICMCVWLGAGRCTPKRRACQECTPAGSSARLGRSATPHKGGELVQHQSSPVPRVLCASRLAADPAPPCQWLVFKAQLPPPRTPRTRPPASPGVCRRCAKLATLAQPPAPALPKPAAAREASAGWVAGSAAAYGLAGYIRHALWGALQSTALANPSAIAPCSHTAK